MAKNTLRDYLAVAVESYDLAATPSPASIFRDTIDETDPLEAPRMGSTGRKSQLDHGIDVKRIFDNFILGLYARRGRGGVERFVTWVKVGLIEQFHTEHREHIKEDRRILNRALILYRRNISQ